MPLARRGPPSLLSSTHLYCLTYLTIRSLQGRQVDMPPPPNPARKQSPYGAQAPYIPDERQRLRFGPSPMPSPVPSPGPSPYLEATRGPQVGYPPRPPLNLYDTGDGDVGYGRGVQVNGRNIPWQADEDDENAPLTAE